MRHLTTLGAVLVALLLVAPAAADTVLAVTEPPEGPNTLSTPQQRFLAVAPILGTVATDPEQYSMTMAPERRTLFAQRSAALETSSARLALWHDLFVNNGRAGLASLANIDLQDYATGSAGTWVLVDRILEGHRVTNDSIYFWELVELNETRARFNVLLLESGIFHDFLTVGPRNNDPYVLGSFTEVTYELVTGTSNLGRSYGLEGAEEAVRVVWTGELLGDGYPDLDTPMPIVVDSLMVRQGMSYNQVRATVALADTAPRLSDYQTVQLMPMPQNSVSIYGAHDFDSHEAYEKVAGRVPVRHLDRYWALARTNPAKYMDPAIMNDPNTVRHMIADGQR